MRNFLARLASLSSAAWAGLLEAALTTATVMLAVRVLPSSWLLGRPRHRPSPQPVTDAAIEERAHLARAFWRYGPLHPNCLERSLILRGLLARHGIVTELKIGVAKPAASLQAHAWLEHRGRVLSDDAPAPEPFPATLHLAPHG